MAARSALTLALVWLGGCEAPSAAPAPAPAPGAPGLHPGRAEPAAESAPAPPAPAPLPAPATAASPGGCRVISSSGQAHSASGQAVRHGDRFAGEAWVVLAQGARIHLKHTVSAREWTVRGPARFLPCVRGEEDIILAQGALGTEIGAGARPGAQVLIGTPFGSVRYADAHSEVWVSPGELRVDVKAGEAWLDSASDAAGSETHARPGAPVRRGRSARFDAAAALRACAAAARASEDRARALLELGARALGERARSHVRAREQARSRCAAAAAAAAQQSSGENLATSLGEIERHGERWRRIPDSSG